jgi:hypothetical protein
MSGSRHWHSAEFASTLAQRRVCKQEVGRALRELRDVEDDSTNSAPLPPLGALSGCLGEFHDDVGVGAACTPGAATEDGANT